MAHGKTITPKPTAPRSIEFKKRSFKPYQPIYPIQPLSLYPDLLQEPGKLKCGAHKSAGSLAGRRSSSSPKRIKPPIKVTLLESRQLEDWINNHSQFYRKPPGIIQIESIFIALQIPYRVSYPTEPGPDFDRY